MTSHRLGILVLPDLFAICRLNPTSVLPAWASSGGFVSMTRTADELSVVCQEQAVPEGVMAEKGWRCLRVSGTFSFSVVGILATLTTQLADAGISLFAISTFDTDYLLVKEEDLAKAETVLRRVGHTVE
jgi:hypothetical protein